MIRCLLLLICITIMHDSYSQSCPDISISAPTNQLACNGSVELTVPLLSGFSYQWFRNRSRIAGATDTAYTATEIGQYQVVIRAGSCTRESAVFDVIRGTSDFPVNIGNDTTLCPLETIKLRSDQVGTAYLWSTGERTREIDYVVTDHGTETVWVVVTNGSCQGSDTLVITVGTPTIDFPADTTLCDLTELSLDATNPNATYRWSTGGMDSTLTVTTSGEYWVEVDNGRCTSADTINVVFDTSPIVDLGMDISLCLDDDDVTFNSNAPSITRLWSTGDATEQLIFEIDKAGDYEVWLYLDNGNCQASDTVSIRVNELPTVSLGADLTGCEGDTFKLDAQNAGASFLWSTSTTEQGYNATVSGTYWVEVNDGNCDNTDTVEVIIAPQPFVDLGADRSVCEDKTIMLDGGNTTATFTYDWSTGEKTQIIEVDKDLSGPVILEVSNDYCVDRDTIELTFFVLPIVDLGADVEVCKGTEVTFATTGFVEYDWSTGAKTPEIRLIAEEAKVFSLVVTDANGCQNTDEVAITEVFALPEVDLGGDLGICKNTSTSFNAGAGFVMYEWNTGFGGQELEVDEVGTYRVKVTDDHGCTATDEARLTKIFPLPEPNLPDAALECETESVLLDAGNYETYLWDDSSDDAERLVTKNGSYSVTVTDKNGCVSTDSIDVIDPCDYVITFPNAFWAAEGAVTATFKPQAKRIVSYNFFVYDRWGKVIYQTTKIGEGWNGEINDKKAPAGMYWYKAFYTGKKQGELESGELSGSLVMVR